MFEVIQFQVKTGQSVACAKKGKVLVALAKVEIYAMGKVAMYPYEELRELQQMKQTARKQFDNNPENEKRLKKIKDLKHNYERSQAMLKAIKSVGLTDTVDDINMITLHLLSVGERVTVETRIDYLSIIEGRNNQLKLFSTWIVLEGDIKYLSTIRFTPELGE
ncbi:hypothetical protein NIES4071_78740 [Calothrix sp. NIES-4071]|nr:hypothetical protein NIES4071_78740 [Calothrix sp. NIES-4071]BAZ62146.1 hypothetical protein NIES4105_78670 [Calothrix sp. NIES-4105]